MCIRDRDWVRQSRMRLIRMIIQYWAVRSEAKAVLSWWLLLNFSFWQNTFYHSEPCKMPTQTVHLLPSPSHIGSFLCSQILSSLWDVYKRQICKELLGGIFLEFHKIRHIENIFLSGIAHSDVFASRNSRWTQSIPVSYTHLDVYKRQIMQLASTIRLPSASL